MLAAATEMEALRIELAKEQNARRKDQPRILDMEQDLKGMYAEHDTHKANKEKNAAELKGPSWRKKRPRSR